MIIKKHIYRVVFCVTLFFAGSKMRAQLQEYDSLKQVLKQAKHDTMRCRIMNAIIELSIDSVWPRYNEQLKTLTEIKLQQTTQNKPEYLIYKKYNGNAFFNLGWYEKEYGSWQQAILYYSKSLKIREEINDLSALPELLNNLAVIYNEKGNSSMALQYYEKSLAMSTNALDKESMSTSLNNIGRVYHNQGNIIKTLEYYNKSLKIKEEIHDEVGVATVLNNLGFVYSEQGDYPTALSYLTRSLKLMESQKDTKGLVSVLNNFSVLYSAKGDYDKAFEYLNKNLKLLEKLNNREAMARCLNNIGANFGHKNDFENALLYMNKGLKIREEINDKRGIANSLYSIGSIYLKSAEMEKTIAKKRLKYRSALEFCLKGLKTAQELKAPYLIRPSAYNTSMVYKVLGNHKKALENYKLYIQMRDSISNEETRKAGIRSQLKYEYEKQAAQDSVAHAKETEIKNAELDRQTAEIKTKKNQQYGLFGGLALVIIFAGFVYNRFKVTQKQKTIIESKEKETQKQNEIISIQKHLVEEKQKEILDSIKYARRIQTALITNEKYIAKNIDRLKNYKT